MSSSRRASTNRPRAALDGVRIIEFGHRLAGPLAAALLADQGAEVIKVERPKGDPGRAEPGFAFWNRGKRSVVADLTTERGRRHVRELVSGADVVIHNLRPGVAERLEIDAEALQRVTPDLIHCSITGFGSGHPDEGRPGWEEIIAARTGVYQPVDIVSKAVFDDAPTAQPQFTPVPIASTFAAMHAAHAVAAALAGRARGTGGLRIEVPLYRAMHTALGRVLVNFEGYRVEETFAWARRVMARIYRCADGRYVQLHGTWPRFLTQTMAAAGRPEWAAEAAPLYGREVDDDVVERWIDRFEELFLERPAIEWEDAISATGGACTMVRDLDEWRAHPQARAGGLVIDLLDDERGLVTQPGRQVHLSRSTAPAFASAPVLGAHSEAIAPRTGRRRAPRRAIEAQLTPGRLPLEGIRVLDLCVVLAGPSGGRALADFGAEVIKIDDPHHLGDPAGNLDVNRGKRSIVVDLKTDDGAQILWDLIDSADVLIENYRAGSLERLGFGYEAVSRRRPDIIYGSMNCHGHRGPWRELPGWEQSAQAATGMQARQGGYGRPPRLVHFPANDYGTGLMGAYAVTLAVFDRLRTGRGQLVDASLSQTATLLQAGLLASAARGAADPDGPGALGWSARSRLYRCADGWIYVHCPDAPTFRELGHALGLTLRGSWSSPTGALATRIERRIAECTMDHWLAEMAHAGVPAEPVRSLAGSAPDVHSFSSGLMVRRSHPGRGFATHVGTVPLVSPTSLRLGRPAPLPGADTRPLLSDLGYAGTRITQLIRAGVVS